MTQIQTQKHRHAVTSMQTYTNTWTQRRQDKPRHSETVTQKETHSDLDTQTQTHTETHRQRLRHTQTYLHRSFLQRWSGEFFHGNCVLQILQPVFPKNDSTTSLHSPERIWKPDDHIISTLQCFVFWTTPEGGAGTEPGLAVCEATTLVAVPNRSILLFCFGATSGPVQEPLPAMHRGTTWCGIPT